MTVSVTVRSRAWGAKVTLAGQESLDLEPNSENTFTLQPGESINVEEPGEAPASDLPLDPNNVPGRAENDALLRPIEEQAHHEVDRSEQDVEQDVERED